MIDVSTSLGQTGLDWTTQCLRYGQRLATAVLGEHLIERGTSWLLGLAAVSAVPPDQGIGAPGAFGIAVGELQATISAKTASHQHLRLVVERQLNRPEHPAVAASDPAVTVVIDGEVYDIYAAASLDEALLAEALSKPSLSPLFNAYLTGPGPPTIAALSSGVLMIINPIYDGEALTLWTA